MSFAVRKSKLGWDLVVRKLGVSNVESGLAFEDANQIAKGAPKLNDGRGKAR
jgi:hypothetical protein